MREIDLARRSLLKLLGGCAAAGVAGCAASETPREGLARLLDLVGEEQRWLDALTESGQRELYDLLSHSPPKATARAVRLVAKVLAPRSRLFAFVRYPTVPDRRSVCDGLIRE
jgi:hypothetical protein